MYATNCILVRTDGNAMYYRQVDVVNEATGLLFLLNNKSVETVNVQL